MVLILLLAISIGATNIFCSEDNSKKRKLEQSSDQSDEVCEPKAKRQKTEIDEFQDFVNLPASLLLKYNMYNPDVKDAFDSDSDEETEIAPQKLILDEVNLNSGMLDRYKDDWPKNPSADEKAEILVRLRLFLAELYEMKETININYSKARKVLSLAIMKNEKFIEEIEKAIE